jgi:hypothetical protein
VVGSHDPVHTGERNMDERRGRTIVVLIHRDSVGGHVFDSFVHERLCSTLFIHVGISGSTGCKLEV